MDVASLAITVLHEIYNIAIFVKDVYTDSKNYDTDKDDTAFKLSHELEVLRLFDRCFFDPSHGVAVDQRLSSHLAFQQPHITNIIVRLRATLEVYRNIGREHFGIDVQGDGATAGGKREAFKHKFADLKRKSWSWALFDKERLIEVVASFKESTDRLKEIYFLIMLDATRVRGVGSQDIQQIQSIDPGLASGLRRQEIAWKVETKQDIDALQPLEGHIEPVPGLLDGDWAAQRVWKYCDVNGRESLVTVEYKRYRPSDLLTNDELLPDQKAFMQIIRGRIQALATILQDDGRDANQTTTSNDSTLHTFKTLGYINQPKEGRFALLFELPRDAPKGPGPVTLAQFLDRNGDIQLEERFFLAHCLGTTLFTLHSSNWLHKNICCSQVVLSRAPCQGYRLTPYLTGFEYSRPSDDRTDGGRDYDIRRNIYRHPRRQGFPREDFRPVHDLFAFGVLLLEIGVKKTMTTYFAKKIQELEKRGELGEPEWFSKEMVRLAEKKLAESMGRRYRDAVLACLRCDFGIEQRDMSRSRLAMAFRDQVLVVIKAGMAL